TLAGNSEALRNPLFVGPKGAKVALSIVIASDKGLAGAYNANVLKAFTLHLKSNAANNSVISIGKNASRFVARLKGVESLGAYDLDTEDLDQDIAQPLLKTVLQQFNDGRVAHVHVIYTKFISTVKQDVVVEQMIPVIRDKNVPSGRIFEPSAEVVFDSTVKRLLEAQVVQYLLESRASEQASRMLAMKSATDNATELIEDLTLVYNNARQAKITQELAEISAGAEAMS
ncbi:MAG: F-type H+-transporting ATPase subunit gamma, partial [Patescibacteria group bacterium]|nr:F-type H+-transporting ATPase subunit gamma [Patescibacteria group bacterium]